MAGLGDMRFPNEIAAVCLREIESPDSLAVRRYSNEVVLNTVTRSPVNRDAPDYARNDHSYQSKWPIDVQRISSSHQMSAATPTSLAKMVRQQDVGAIDALIATHKTSPSAVYDAALANDSPAVVRHLVSHPAFDDVELQSMFDEAVLAGNVQIADLLYLVGADAPISALWLAVNRRDGGMVAYLASLPEIRQDMTGHARTVALHRGYDEIASGLASTDPAQAILDAIDDRRIDDARQMVNNDSDATNEAFERAIKDDDLAAVSFIIPHLTGGYPETELVDDIWNALEARSGDVLTYLLSRYDGDDRKVLLHRLLLSAITRGRNDMVPVVASAPGGDLAMNDNEALHAAINSHNVDAIEYLLGSKSVAQTVDTDDLLAREKNVRVRGAIKRARRSATKRRK